MQTFDYIIVGAGSAGSVVASRLSEDPAVRVLLIEAGGSHRRPNVHVPAAFATQFKTKLDWEYYTEDEPGLEGRSVHYPRGRMLGGSSGMNAMIYMRGNRHDYDGWARSGATGWAYDDLLPLFKRSETNSRGRSEYHGDRGPLHIEDLRSPREVSFAMVDAMVEADMPRNDDFNGASQDGAGFNQSTIRRGRRWTTADGYLTPARRRTNLEIWKNTPVRRVRMDGTRADGVDVVRHGRAVAVRAEREVVLSGGAINTPQLLMLSGIGPAAHLSDHGIAPVVDNQHVGSHLKDHPFYIANFEVQGSDTLFDAQSPKHVLNYLVRQRGPLSSNVGETNAFFRSGARPDDDLPDIQIIGAPAYFWDFGAATHDRPAIAFGISVVAPTSEGAVRLRSGDPAAPPRLSLNLLDQRIDMDAMLGGVERIRDVARAPSLRSLVTKELHPGGGVSQRQALETEIRRQALHTFHVSSTARIGAEGEGVVDPQLRVHGTQGLRVADASVFPTVVRGNTHAASVMAGEKAADLIRAHH